MTSTTSATTANTTVPTPFSCPFSAGWRGRRDSSNSANCSKYSILALASSCSRRISSSRRACSPLGSRMQSKYSCPGANRCTGSVRCCFLRYSFITPKLQLSPQKTRVGFEVYKSTSLRVNEISIFRDFVEAEGVVFNSQKKLQNWYFCEFSSSKRRFSNSKFVGLGNLV